MNKICGSLYIRSSINIMFISPCSIGIDPVQFTNTNKNEINGKYVDDNL